MSTLPERARQAATNSLNARRDTDLGSNAELLNELADEIERLQAECNALRRWSKAAKNAYYDAMQCLHYEAYEGLPAHKALHPDDWERLKNWLTELKSAREAAEKARSE